ncbi:hypothetical protein HCA58_12550 [Micromonospora sp. HNM0581]|uniref:hypothetical protein n=1 Tax=Micromonospora sp. HNM0581 TaxID=2716341 RepID=UPI00146EDEEC|nr:hypothetical protein [Micromonospora sp. HNM0581]NLU79192.1 hypothetical protein [Micromonospora sp. HNM0581]
MRWLRQLLGSNQVQLDPGRQQALLREVTHHHDVDSPLRFPAHVEAITRILDDDDGLVVAARMVIEAAEEAHADLQAQAHHVLRHTGRRLLVNRRNYRPLWKEAAPALRWPLFALPSGLHPYVQVTAAVSVIGSRAPRLGQVTDPDLLLARAFEMLDLTIIGWEYGRVRVDTDAAALADRLITATGQVLAALDDPPRLPPPVREMMRRNNTLDVHDPTGPRVVDRINPGARMRETLLV